MPFWLFFVHRADGARSIPATQGRGDFIGKFRSFISICIENDMFQDGIYL